MLFNTKLKPFSPIINQIIENCGADYMASIEDLWQKFRPFASPSFQREFLTNEGKYYSLLWEMFLTCQFLDQGFTVEPNPDDDRPDICLKINGHRVWVECCIPTRGDPSSPDFEPELPYDGSVRAINHDASVLRCTGALAAKRLQHKKWLEKGICRAEEPYIIALNGLFLDLRISNNMMPQILRGLYGMGDPYATFNVDGDESKEEQGYDVQTQIEKKNESKVPTTFFLDDASKKVAGVIFSTDWIAHASTEPDYCYVRNKMSEIGSDFGFEKFMQTYNYSDSDISMKSE